MSFYKDAASDGRDTVAMKIIQRQRFLILIVSCACFLVAGFAASRRLIERRALVKSPHAVSKHSDAADTQAREEFQPTAAPAPGPIEAHVVAGGGGTSTGGSIRIDGTIGEVSAGNSMAGGSFALSGGFWNNLSSETSTPTPSPTPTPTATPTPSPGATTIQFLSALTVVSESSLNAVITITRAGVISGTSSVKYLSTDTDNFTVPCSDSINNQGAAYGRCDYATAFDTLTFLPGESSKTISIPIIDDSSTEANESFSVVLSNPTGATLGSPSVTTVSIMDNDAVNGPNPIFTTPFFVRQHYLDFLSREPEVGEPWTNVLNNCSDVNN
ncbi:MAG TPA: Calx-beta domain-containing protein, partial [Pyrinomonadaceae bacterium]